MFIETFYSIQVFFLFFSQFTELPWDEPTTGCVEFVKWKSDNSWMTMTPWSKLETLVLSLLRKILEPDSRKRITVKQIIDHKWCKAIEQSGMFSYFDGISKFVSFLFYPIQAINLEHEVRAFIHLLAHSILQKNLLAQVLSDSQWIIIFLRALEWLVKKISNDTKNVS